ncbi:hypothetical protein FB45DRAFT_1118106 [Roridomyces roridus]|uniref:F-box domain-containing protein n=1 Tax=Roridomyces roridus TaxID=1738132 RepID=A0AAD7B779_9AGAR|nr:hypothetical protein FB45DRAFT_1118106 [Roridomyces roridus]
MLSDGPEGHRLLLSTTMVLTRNGHRARMQITRWLPNEVLSQIIQFAPLADQAVFCRTSKLFHALSLPIVNRSVCIETETLDTDSIAAFCLSMIQNPERAGATREMAVMFNNPDREREEANYGKILNTIKLMLNLEDLSLLDYTESLALLDHPQGLSSMCSGMANLNFPHLSSCRLVVASIDEKNHAPIMHFLTRHPNLTHLRIWVAFRDTHPPPASRLRLPKLRHYEGTSIFLSYILTERLKRAHVSVWGWDALETEQIVESLRSLTDPNRLFTLSNDYDELDSQEGLTTLRESLRALSSRMPYITSLRVRSSTSIHAQIQPVLENLTLSLKPFERLVFLAATQDTGPAPPQSDVRAAIKKWTKWIQRGKRVTTISNGEGNLGRLQDLRLRDTTTVFSRQHRRLDPKFHKSGATPPRTHADERVRSLNDKSKKSGTEAEAMYIIVFLIDHDPRSRHQYDMWSGVEHLNTHLGPTLSPPPRAVIRSPVVSPRLASGDPVETRDESKGPVDECSDAEHQ